MLALTLVLGGSAIASAAPRSVRDGVRYLERAQNSDGGFGGAPRQASNQLITGWTVLGLEAAGRHPLDVRSGARTPIDFIRAGVRSLAETGELERTILALRGAGLDPRRFGGRDLLADLERKRRPDGSFSGLSNWTAFGIMALRASGRSTGSAGRCAARARGSRASRTPTEASRMRPAAAAASWTRPAAALQGLAAAGRRRTRVVERCGRIPARRAEPRRRVRPGRRLALQRAVDRVGGAGPRRRRPRPGLVPPRRPLAPAPT